MSTQDEMSLKVENTSLFENLKFCLVDLPEDKCDYVKRLLIDGGARQMSYMSDMVTHVVADNDESADVSEAKEIFEKPVVTSSWVIMSVKCNVLLPIEGFSPDSEQLFSSVVACPSKLSLNDCHTLWAIFTYYGGKFKLKYDKSVTHLISALPIGKKYEKAMSQGIKIVTPDWAHDSVTNKIRCDEDLYHTKLLILPKSPTPSPPPPPTPPPPLPVKTVAEPLQLASNQVVSSVSVPQMLQQPLISTVASQISQPIVSAQPQTSFGLPQKILLQERMPVPQSLPHQTQISTGITSTTEGIRTTMNWQHRPPQTILTPTAGGANPRAALWQQQLIAQRRLTPQQQMILQQKWAHQQSANRQIGVQRLQTPHQQIQLTQQQRLHLPNQQIQISQGQPVINQQIQVRKPHPNQQMPVVHKRLPAPNQQIQISRAQMQQLSNQLNTQGQIPPNQLVRKAQIANVHMNLQLQQQASHQRLQLLQHSRQTVPSQQMSVNEQTQMNQQKNVPLYQLVAQQQVSGTINQQSQIPRQLNQQSQIASQLPQQVRLSGPRPQVHSQINQPPQIHGQVNRQPQVSGQIPQQPRIPTQVGQPPEMPIQVSQQSQIPIQVSQRPQILTQVSQQPQIPNQISQQPQIPNQVNQRPQIPTLPNQMSQRPPIPSQINQRPQIPTLPAQMGQRPQIPSQMSQRPQIPTLPTQMNQRPQLPSQMSQRPQIPSQMSQRPQIPSQMSQRPQMPSQMSQRPQIPPQVSQQPQILTQISQQTPVTGQINQPLQAPRQLNPQQRQILWQQQRPQGRVVIQQGSQPAQGLRQVPFDVQQQGQNQKLPQGLWQQKQMILANQQRQVANRMQLAAGQQRMVSQQNVPTHPPPPYPGKANQPTEPPQAFREVTQQQTIPVPGQQIINVNSAGQIVTPKTKTALANLLNTRLQTGNISPNSKESTENISLQAPMKVENSRKKEQVAENSLPIKPAIQLYGHDFDVNVPPSSCLLGCTFCICDYESPTNKVDMWKKIVLYHGGEVEPTYSPQCTHVICESTKNPVMQQALREAKRCISAFWLNDVIIQRNMIPPWKAVHIPSPCIHDKPCKKQIIAISGFEGNDRKCLQEMILISGARYTGHLCQSNTLLIAKKNDGQKFKKATEWRIPVVSVQWLNDILSGHYEALRSPLSQKYQNYNLDNAFKLDYTNIHHLMFAWRSPVKVTEAMLSKCVERPPLRTLNTVQNSQSCNKLEPPSKRIRLSSESGHNVGLKPRIMFSGIKDVAELTNIVIRLGGSISTSTKDCTHLVIKTVIRTVKLFLTISTCEFIVTVDWLLDSSKQNKFLEEDLFIPDNPQAEAEMGFNIKNTLKRKDRSLILKGFTFYVTPSVPPSYNVLCLIIENNSGKVVKKPLKINEIKATNKVSVKYVIISTEDDIHLCQRYITNGIDVYNPEVVLTGIMNQNFDLEIFKYKLKTSATGQRMYC